MGYISYGHTHVGSCRNKVAVVGHGGKPMCECVKVCHRILFNFIHLINRYIKVLENFTHRTSLFLVKL